MNELVETHMKLAEMEAHKFHRRNPPVLEYDDILQEAYYGLIRASYGYDSSKGVLFASYASVAIQNRLKRVHTKAKSTVTCGCDSKIDGLLRKVIFESKGRFPSAEDIISRYKVPLCSAKTIILKYRCQSLLRLDKKLEDSTSSVIDIMDLGHYKRPDLMCERKDLEGYLLTLVKLLPHDWKNLIDRRYFKGMKLREMAELEGISPPAIEHKLEHAINALRTEMGE